MTVVEICREFGWDYHTYMNQPTWFLDLIMHKFEIDSVKAKHEAAKGKHK